MSVSKGLAMSPRKPVRHHRPELAAALRLSPRTCIDYGFFQCPHFLPTLARRRDIVSQSWILPTVVIYNCLEIKVEK